MQLSLKLVGIEEPISMRLGRSDHFDPPTKHLLNSVIRNFIVYFKKSLKIDCADSYMFLGVKLTRPGSTN